MTREINLNHIAKVEGHANLTLKIENGKVKKCELQATEGARFFEALVLNKDVKDVQEIVTRICGICSVAHSVASIQALEEALGIKPLEKQKALRELLMIGERIRSNTTHLYFLSLPDYYNSSSILDLIKKDSKQQEKVNDALALISLGNKIIETFGGREIHPFLAINEEIQKINPKPVIEQLNNSKNIVKKTIKLFKELKYPKIERDIDYLSLKDKDNYGIISGKITSETGLIDDEDYKKHIKENIKEYATSKFALQIDEETGKENSFFVTGAIARLNNNYSQLDEESKEFLKDLKLPLKNPFYNNFAQALELLHLSNRAIKLIEILNKDSAKKENKEIKIKAGHAVSAVEAPRGTLFHEYKIDNQGKISYCNILTPTVQNLNMMEQDITEIVNKALSEKKSKEQIVKEVEKLIRAYDPCFSCSTHFLKVDWE